MLVSGLRRNDGAGVPSGVIGPALVIGLSMLLSACGWPAGARAPAIPSDFEPGRLIVGFYPGTGSAARVGARTEGHSTKVEAILANDEEWTLAPGASPQALAIQMAKDPAVKFAQPDYIRHLQGFSASEYAQYPATFWDLGLLDITAAWNVNQPATWQTFSTAAPPGKGVMVAVVDSGVDVRHPDLASNIARDSNGNIRYLDEIAAQGSSDLWVPPVGPTMDYDWATSYGGAPCPSGDSCPGPDGNGHGTHVAGILAAVGNNAPGLTCSSGPCNMVGVAPGATILPVKTMRADGSGDDATIARGLRDAVDAGAKVINLSVGGPEPSPLLADAMAYDMAKGALLVVASGNDGLAVNYPAAYTGAVAVGAIGNPADPGYPQALADGAPYTSHGPQLALVAPGGSATTACPESQCGVYSTVPTYACYITLTGKVGSTGYGRLTGTSMATPLVSGIAGMILAREPALTPAQLRERLIADTTPVAGTSGGFTDQYGYGLIDPAKALTQVSPDGS